MSNELTLKEFILTEIGANHSELGECIENYLRTTHTKLTNEELKQFVMLCKIHNLNPLKREIYAIKWGNQLQIVVNYYEYIKRADKTGLVDYYGVEVVYNDDKSIDKAIFTGKRKDQTKEMVMVFPFKEWFKQQLVWKEKPHFMIEKVALANGLRRLFPNEIAELPYTQEEDYITKDLVQPAKITKKAEEKSKELEEKEVELANVI